MKSNVRLKLVPDVPTERIYGSERFIRRTRNPAKVASWPFAPAKRVGKDDVWL